MTPSNPCCTLPFHFLRFSSPPLPSHLLTHDPSELSLIKLVGYLEGNITHTATHMSVAVTPGYCAQQKTLVLSDGFSVTLRNLKDGSEELLPPALVPLIPTIFNSKVREKS